MTVSILNLFQVCGHEMLWMWENTVHGALQIDSVWDGESMGDDDEVLAFPFLETVAYRGIREQTLEFQGTGHVRERSVERPAIVWPEEMHIAG